MLKVRLLFPAVVFRAANGCLARLTGMETPHSLSPR